MSDPIADAAAQPADAAPSSTEPVQAPEVAQAGELPESSAASTTSATPEPSSADAPNADASTSPAGAVTPAITGNVLVNSTPTVDAPVLEAGGALMGEPTGSDSLTPSTATSDEPPRESLIARMHAAIDELEAKVAAGVHVFAHEVAALRDHIAKVL